MKRIALYLLALLLLLQTACGKPTDVPENIQTAPEETVEEQPAEPEQEAPPAEEENLAPEVAVETPPVVEETPKASILDQRQQLDETGTLWHVPNERVEANLQQHILSFGENLLLWGSGAGADGSVALNLALLSLETGEVLQEVSFPGYDLPDVQGCGDVIAVTDWSDGEIRLLDANLQVTGEYDTGTESCVIYPSPDGSRAYCFTKEGVLFLEFATGLTGPVLDNTAHLLAAGKCGKHVSFTYTDPTTQLDQKQVLDLSTGTIEAIPFEGAFYSAMQSNGLWLATLADDSGYYLGRAGHPNLLQPTAQYGTVTLLSDPTRVLVTAYDENGYATVSLYEADGSFLSEITLPVQGGAITGEPVWSQEEGGYFFTMINALGNDMLFFWDLSTPLPGEELKLTQISTEPEVGTAVSAALYDRANALSETYGVTVKIAEQAQTEYSDFIAAPILSEDYISAGLNSLETVLSAYPDGFLEQLRYGSNGPLEIHLVGQLTKTSTYEDTTAGFTNFVGLTADESAAVAIAINITMPGSMEQTLHHELMHAIDNKLTFDANLREGALFSEEGWSQLNPAGFAYAESYHNLPASIYNDGYEAWFTELYSRTFAREDRATIMEHAMMHSDWTFSASPGRLAKLEYLCQCIRDAFDTTGWPEMTVWEATLARCK